MLVFLRPVAADLLLRECADDQEQGDAVFIGVDELGHAVWQADIGNAADADFARQSRIAVRHGDDHAFLHAFDELNRRLIDESIENRCVAGRRIEEVIFNPGCLELLQIELPAGAGDVPHGAGRVRRGLGAHRRERLRHSVGGNGAQPGRAQVRHQGPARDALIKVLLDQFLHGPFLPWTDHVPRSRLHGFCHVILNGRRGPRYRLGR
jgi:hypothetical protein